MATSSGNYLDTGMSASWTEDLTVRESINGDKCIIGASISGLTLSPAATGSGSTYRNGAVLNTTSGTQHPFDGRASTFSSGLAFTATTASAGDSILFTDSATDPAATSGYDSEGRSNIDYAMVLSIIASGDDPGAGVDFFRPAYAGATKVIHLVSEINESLLPSLAKASVASAPANLTALTDRFKRVQVDHIYNPVGQEIRPKFHMPSYGADIARDISDALTALTLDYTIVEKRPLLYAIIQYGIDLYYAMLYGNTIWPVNGGHNIGRKAVVTFTAIMLQNTSMKDQITEWSKPGGQLFHEDLAHRHNANAGLTLFGAEGTQAAYLSVLAGGSGSKAIVDPLGWIDGGELPGGSYQGIGDPYMVAVAMLADNITGWEAVWGTESAKYGHRIAEFGTWTLPDNRDTDGNIDCANLRFPARHGGNHQNTAYDSQLVIDTRSVHFTTEHLIQPSISPYRPAAAAQSHEITLTPFGYVDSGCTRHASVPADGTWPYISSGVSIYYTLDGSEPTTSSTLYSAPFTVDTTDAVDGVVTVKAIAVHASYENSPVVTSTYNIANFIRQTKQANSADNSVASISATFDQTPLDGSVIIAQSSVRARTGSLAFSDNETSGDAYNYVVQQSATAPCGSFAWKVANGTGDTVTATNPSTVQRMQISIMEVINVQTASLAGSASTTSGVATDVNSKSSGTTASLAAGNYFAVAGFTGANNETALGTTRTYTNDFTEPSGGSSFVDAAFRAGGSLATKVIESSGTVESTIGFEQTDFNGSAGMMVFTQADLIAPTVESVSIPTAGNTVAITFSEAMNTSNTTGFSVSGVANNNQTYTLSNPAWSAGDSVLTFDMSSTARAELNTEEGTANGITLSYAAGNVEDVAGNALAAISNRTVSNLSTQGLLEPVPAGTAEGLLRVDIAISGRLFGSSLTVDQDKITIRQDGEILPISSVSAPSGAGTGNAQFIVTTSPLIYSSASGVLRVVMEQGAMYDNLGNQTEAIDIADADNSSEEVASTGGLPTFYTSQIGPMRRFNFRNGVVDYSNKTKRWFRKG